MGGSGFAKELRDRATDPADRSWLYIPYDQLSDRIGPLATEPPSELGIVLVESPHKARRRPYHKQKLGLVLANLRHFALEQAERGVAVRHVVHDGPYAEALAPLASELGPLRVQEPAERELRQELAPLVQGGQLVVLPHGGWLTEPEDFEAGGGRTWRMDAFYRRVRKRTGILMEDGSPVGGKLSFDAENRQPWKGTPPAPVVPRFRPTAITREVCELVDRAFPLHPGELDPGAIPASRSQIARLWDWALTSCLPHFGPYEDAMSDGRATSSTRASPRCSTSTDCYRAPWSRTSWRRTFPSRPRRASFARFWDGASSSATSTGRPTGFETSWEAALELPRCESSASEVFWGTAESGMRCLDRTVQRVWKEGYGHHITRLMVLSNLATLLDVDPKALSDWFRVAYADAFDWVVEPNVLGMGTFSLGPLFTTKPYVCGAAYIARMSDHCGACAFDPKSDCPITSLYWAFLARHEERLAGNPRLAMPLRSLARRSAEQRRSDAETFERVGAALDLGQRIAMPSCTSRAGEEGRSKKLGFPSRTDGPEPD